MSLEGPSGNIWLVRARNRKSSSFAAGWRAFAYDHHLHEGDQLHFTLVKNSHFVVEIFNKHGGIRKSARTATKSGIFAYVPTYLPSLVESGKRKREEYCERYPGASAIASRRYKVTNTESEYGETTLGFTKLVPGLGKGKEVITILESGDEEEKEKSFMSEELRKKLSFGNVYVQKYRASKIERLMEYMRDEGRNVPEKLQLPKHEVKEQKGQNTDAEMHEAEHCKRNGDVANVVYEADEEIEEDTSSPEEEYDNPLHKFTKMFSKSSQKANGRVVKVATVEKQNAGLLGSMQPANRSVPSEIMVNESFGGFKRVEEDKVGADSIQPMHGIEIEDTAMRVVNDYVTKKQEIEFPLSTYEMELDNSLEMLGRSDAAPKEEQALPEAYKPVSFLYESSKSDNIHITPQQEEISMQPWLQPTHRGSEIDPVHSLNKNPLTKTSLLQYDSEETVDEMIWQVTSNHINVSDSLLQLASIACDHTDTLRVNCVQDINPASSDPPKLVEHSADIRTDCTKHESGTVTVLTSKQSSDGNERTAWNAINVQGSMELEVTVQEMYGSVTPIKEDPYALQDDGNAKGMIQFPKKLDNSLTLYAEVDQNLHIHSGETISTGTIEASSYLGQDEDTGNGGAMAEKEKLLRVLPDLSLQANGMECESNDSSDVEEMMTVAEAETSNKDPDATCVLVSKRVTVTKTEIDKTHNGAQESKFSHNHDSSTGRTSFRAGMMFKISK